MYNKSKQIKYKKFRKSKLKKFEFKSNNKLKFGVLGLKATESGIIKSTQLFSAKQTIMKKIKKKGKIWIMIFPDLSITSKNIGSRMGKGKGVISHWAARISCGNILFEICSVNINIAFSALKTAGSKLPIKTKIVN